MFYFLLSAYSWAYEPQNGDVIFQSSGSSQSEEIQLATQSKFSHVGIVYLDVKRGPVVFEAIAKVSLTSLAQWIARGEGKHYQVMRSKKALSKKQLLAMKQYGESLRGKRYDLLFQWSDQKMYCSELVWKVYQHGAGIELAIPKTFDSYNFDHPKVQKKLQERWGRRINWKEKVVAPSDLAQSDALRLVETTYP